MADRDQSRTYLSANSVVFRKTNERFGGLSNMAPGFPLEVNGIRIRTSEALYQACRFPHLPEVQRLIIGEHSPMTAKMKSKPHRKKTRSDWEKVRVSVMRWCLRVKLAQNWHRFRNLLLATEDQPIVEESRKDAFWGAKPIDSENLKGKNVLGRLLMELREELRGNGDKLKRVEPLNIPQFLLLGNPIGVLGATDQAVDQDEKALGGPTPSTGIQVPEALPYAQSFEPKPMPKVGEPLTRGNSLGGVAIPNECKRLAEVDFPIAEVSKHSAREKSIRHGHPSTLHLWWARRPLAACRAMLMALLLPDPCDEHCPVEFKEKARDILLGFHGRPKGWDKQIRSDKGLREIILKFIADFANWDNSSNPDFLTVGRGLVSAAHPDEPPLVVDPFAGGGSIPLEALRLGCETFASDLNPVACLILKVMLEDIPRYGREKVKVKRKNGEEVEAAGLAEALRIVGKEIKDEAEKELAEFYPKDPDGSTPIAYLWARTVRCEAPNCGAEIPLMRSFWLCKKANRKRALRWEENRQKEKGKNPEVVFEIFEPLNDKEVPSGTVTRAKATCLFCGTVLPPERVRAQLAEQRGGADVIFDKKGQRLGGARLLAVVGLNPNEQGRRYRLPTDQDYRGVWKAQKQIEHVLNEWELSGKKGLCPVPDEPLPKERQRGSSGFRVLLYGMRNFGDLFTARQKTALAHLCNLLILPEGHIDTLRILLAFAFNRVAMSDMTCTRWNAVAEKMQHTFGRQAIPIVWDFAEVVPIASAPGNWESGYSLLGDVIQSAAGSELGQVQLADAIHHPLPDRAASVWFTDPPYYDAIAYADLSDFFFVWLKRTLLGHPLLGDPFNLHNTLTPKRQEAIQDPARSVDGEMKDRDYYEKAMAGAFLDGRRILKKDGIGSVVFAHKTTEGWEALLTGMNKGGWIITGSWPISTEMGTRLNARETASLATSVHLVCRPRPVDASVGDWGDVLRELPGRVGDWMERLQSEGVRGADLVFACIGPALEMYSKYSKVVDAEEREIPLGGDPLAIDPHKRGYLAYVWEAVGRAALEQVLGTAEAQARNSHAGALEEDARLTALFLWTLQSTNGGNGKNGKAEAEAEEDDEEDEGEPRGKTKGHTMVFDVVRRFAQPLGINLPKWEGRIIETKKGVVRLLPVSERAKVLFGSEGAKAVAYQLESTPRPDTQLLLFPGAKEHVVAARGAGGKRVRSMAQAAELSADAAVTTLDRVHAAMLLQAGGMTNALRALMKAEKEKGPGFLRLANALSALLKPLEASSALAKEEKRLIDAMLLAMPK